MGKNWKIIEENEVGWERGKVGSKKAEEKQKTCCKKKKNMPTVYMVIVSFVTQCLFQFEDHTEA